jgi:hypothetical protein
MPPVVPPPWAAVTTQLPTATAVIERPEIEQILTSAELSVTVKPESDIAPESKLVPTVFELGCANVIV